FTWRLYRRYCDRSRLNLTQKNAVQAVAVFPDGQTLAWVVEDGPVCLVDMTGKPRVLAEGGVNTLALSPDGKLLATGGADGVKLWDPATATLVAKVPDTPFCQCLAFAPDGKTLASGGDRKDIHLIDVSKAVVRSTLPGQAIVWSVAFSPDGSTLLSGSQDRTARLWDVATGKETKTFAGHTGPVYAV